MVEKTLGPIEAVPRKHAFFSGVDMELDAVAVVFDFVNPLLTLGSRALQGRKLGLNERRHLDTLNHTQLTKSPAAAGGADDRAQFKPLRGYE